MITVGINDLEVRNVYNKLIVRCEKQGPAMRAIAGIMLSDVRDNFKAGGRPEPWAKLSMSTILQREKHGYWPGTILTQRGELKNSIVAFSDDNSAGVSTNKGYAAAQNFGTMDEPIKHPGSNKLQAWGDVIVHKTAPHDIKIPQREFMVLSDDAKEEMIYTMADYLAKM